VELGSLGLMNYRKEAETGSMMSRKPETESMNEWGLVDLEGVKNGPFGVLSSAIEQHDTSLKAIAASLFCHMIQECLADQICRAKPKALTGRSQKTEARTIGELVRVRFEFLEFDVESARELDKKNGERLIGVPLAVFD
jgi:hypothetical protein